ncbi:MAG: hypothetical protein GX575_00590 [Candidatus Anammoximicrobium sp.]|nr:hypothetical protein [Candidatus Anammoximicrobium sp.]
MRNLFAFVLLGAAVSFGWGLAPSELWAQEQPATGDMDVSFDIEGADFDVEAQREAAAQEGLPPGVVIAALLVVLAVGLAVILLWKAIARRKSTAESQGTSRPPSDSQA